LPQGIFDGWNNDYIMLRFESPCGSRFFVNVEIMENHPSLAYKVDSNLARNLAIWKFGDELHEQLTSVAVIRDFLYV
jgi:hypothetical protein